MLKIIIDLVILLIIFPLTRDYMNMNMRYTLPCIGSILLLIPDPNVRWGVHLNRDREGRAIECLFQYSSHFLNTKDQFYALNELMVPYE